MANEYIINAQLEETIAMFQEAKRKKDINPEYQEQYDILQERLAYFFYELSENIINAFGFKLIDHDDALQEGVLIALQKVDRFDHTYVGKNGKKAKAFNYMTTCILNHFRQLYRGAKNHHELQRRYYEHLIDKLDVVMRDWGSNGQVRAVYRDGGSSFGQRGTYNA
jgi:DNA-directed RNA polymerase specialized sigma24 family protein